MFGSNSNPFNNRVGAPTTSLFGSTSGSTFGTQQPPAVTAQASSLFGVSSGFGNPGGTLFGALGAASLPLMTMPRFNPPIGTDSSEETMTCGVAQLTVNTKHMVITAMKEFQQVSLEELRMEDYMAGRERDRPHNHSPFSHSSLKRNPPVSSGVFGYGGAAGTAARPNFGFGSAPAPGATAGVATSASSLFGGTAAVQPAASSTLFGVAAAAPNLGGGFTFGTTAASTTSGTSAFGFPRATGVGVNAFGWPGIAAKSQFGSQPPTSLAATSAAPFGFQQPPQQAQSCFGFPQPQQQLQQQAQAPFTFCPSASTDEALLQQARVQQQVLDLVYTLPYGTGHLVPRQTPLSVRQTRYQLLPQLLYQPQKPQRPQQSLSHKRQHQALLTSHPSAASAFSTVVSPESAGCGHFCSRPRPVAHRNQLFDGFDCDDSQQQQQQPRKTYWKRLKLSKATLRACGSLSAAPVSALAPPATAADFPAAAAASAPTAAASASRAAFADVDSTLDAPSAADAAAAPVHRRLP